MNENLTNKRGTERFEVAPVIPETVGEATEQADLSSVVADSMQPAPESTRSLEGVGTLSQELEELADAVNQFATLKDKLVKDGADITEKGSLLDEFKLDEAGEWADSEFFDDDMFAAIHGSHIRQTFSGKTKKTFEFLKLFFKYLQGRVGPSLADQLEGFSKQEVSKSLELNDEMEPLFEEAKQFAGEAYGSERTKNEEELNTITDGISDKVIDKIKGLETKESFLFFGKVKGQSMLFEVCNEGDKKYSFTIYNTGSGLEYHNKGQMKRGGKQTYQCYMTFTNCQMEDVINKKMWQTLSYLRAEPKHDLRGPKAVYHEVQNVMKSNPQISSTNLTDSDETPMSRQVTENSFWKVAHPKLRKMLGVREYKRLKFEIKMLTLLAYYKKHEKELAKDPEKRKLIMEAVRRLAIHIEKKWDQDHGDEKMLVRATLALSEITDAIKKIVPEKTLVSTGSSLDEADEAARGNRLAEFFDKFKPEEEALLEKREHLLKRGQTIKDKVVKKLHLDKISKPHLEAPKLPSLSFSIPSVSLSMPKLNLPTISFKRPSFSFPSLNISLPNVKIPKMGVHVPTPNLHLPKVNIPMPAIKISGLKFPFRAPNLHLPRVNIPILTINIPNLKFSIPTPNISMPHVNISIPKMGVHVPTPNLHLPKVNIPMPAIKIPGLKFPFRAPNLHLPRVNIPMPTINMPNLKFSVPIPSVSLPHVNISIPNVHIPKMGIHVPTPNLHLPKVNIPMPAIKIPGLKFPFRAPNLHLPRVNIPIPTINMPKGMLTGFARSIPSPVSGVHYLYKKVPSFSLSASLPKRPHFNVSRPKMSAQIKKINKAYRKHVPKKPEKVPGYSLPTFKKPKIGMKVIFDINSWIDDLMEVQSREDREQLIACIYRIADALGVPKEVGAGDIWDKVPKRDIVQVQEALTSILETFITTDGVLKDQRSPDTVVIAFQFAAVIDKLGRRKLGKNHPIKNFKMDTRELEMLATNSAVVFRSPEMAKRVQALLQYGAKRSKKEKYVLASMGDKWETFDTKELMSEDGRQKLTQDVTDYIDAETYESLGGSLGCAEENKKARIDTEVESSLMYLDFGEGQSSYYPREYVMMKQAQYFANAALRVKTPPENVDFPEIIKLKLWGSVLSINGCGVQKIEESALKEHMQECFCEVQAGNDVVESLEKKEKTNREVLCEQASVRSRRVFGIKKRMDNIKELELLACVGDRTKISELLLFLSLNIEELSNMDLADYLDTGRCMRNAWWSALDVALFGSGSQFIHAIEEEPELLSNVNKLIERGLDLCQRGSWYNLKCALALINTSKTLDQYIAAAGLTKRFPPTDHLPKLQELMNFAKENQKHLNPSDQGAIALTRLGILLSKKTLTKEEWQIVLADRITLQTEGVSEHLKDTRLKDEVELLFKERVDEFRAALMGDDNLSENLNAALDIAEMADEKPDADSTWTPVDGDPFKFKSGEYVLDVLSGQVFKSGQQKQRVPFAWTDDSKYRRLFKERLTCQCKRGENGQVVYEVSETVRIIASGTNLKSIEKKMKDGKWYTYVEGTNLRLSTIVQCDSSKTRDAHS